MRASLAAGSEGTGDISTAITVELTIGDLDHTIGGGGTCTIDLETRVTTTGRGTSGPGSVDASRRS